MIKNLILSAVILFFIHLIFGERHKWTLITQKNESSSEDIYLDYGSKKENENGYVVDFLADYHYNEKGWKPALGFSSMKATIEMDCNKEQARVLSATAFSERMGKGLAENKTVTDNWISVYSDPGTKALGKKLCGRWGR